MSDERRLYEMIVELESDINESENPWDCRFAKRFRNPKTFGFRFKLCHKPTTNAADFTTLH